MNFKDYMYSCGKFVRITARHNLWGQTLTFGDKVWFSKSGIFKDFELSFMHIFNHKISQNKLFKKSMMFWNPRHDEKNSWVARIWKPRAGEKEFLITLPLKKIGVTISGVSTAILKSTLYSHREAFFGQITTNLFLH